MQDSSSLWPVRHCDHEDRITPTNWDNRFYSFPHYIETTTFGISCDAYTNLKETLTRHKPMVADYLEKNYDRVRNPVHLFIFSPWMIPSLHSAVLLILYDTHLIYQLRHKASVPQASWGDSSGPCQLQCDDSVYCQRGQLEDDDEPTSW